MINGQTKDVILSFQKESMLMSFKDRLLLHVKIILFNLLKYPLSVHDGSYFLCNALACLSVYYQVVKVWSMLSLILGCVFTNCSCLQKYRWLVILVLRSRNLAKSLSNCNGFVSFQKVCPIINVPWVMIFALILF